MTTIFSKYWSFRNKYLVMERFPDYFIPKYFSHTFEPFFTYFFYKIRFTPNMVTILSSFVMLAASYTLYNRLGWITLFLVGLYLILDSCDGGLARFTKHTTEFGDKLDKVCDKIVRGTFYTVAALIADVPLALKVIFFLTLWTDLFMVQKVVVPFMKEHRLYRGKIKSWFLNRGIIPAFDIFWIMTSIALFSALSQDYLMILTIIIGKNFDWIYRVFEVQRTKMMIQKGIKF